MTRPSKAAAINFTATHSLTHSLLERAKCPPDKSFALLKDVDKKGLRLRITPFGKHWQFETRIKGKLFTRALGEWPTIGIAQAQAEAHRLRGLTELGIDPRTVERQQAVLQAEQEVNEQRVLEAKAFRTERERLTMSEVWSDYLEKRRPFWGDLHYRDHLDKSKLGGEPSKRRGSKDTKTKPGPLASLLDCRMIDLTHERIEKWAELEAQTRPSSARLSLRLLSVFLTWCSEQKEYASLLPTNNPAKTKKTREALGKPAVKSDVLQRGQLKVWFAAVRQIQNPAIAAYLQILLLTGARRGEVLALKWVDVNTQWKGVTIRDKIEGTREVPLTPYVASLIARLPRRNEWVFSSATSRTGCLTVPHTPHARACRVAGLDGLTLHGLRRSFKSLTEWLEVPVGIVAQLQGHKPSATAEKHYTVRPLELLAIHHEKIERWILEQADIQLEAESPVGTLRVLKGI
jgi:integrase